MKRSVKNWKMRPKKDGEDSGAAATLDEERDATEADFDEEELTMRTEELEEDCAEDRTEEMEEERSEDELAGREDNADEREDEKGFGKYTDDAAAEEDETTR